ncbi:MAG: MBL fold metallo-hydrolase [Candidatus Portnoybacteria bacterium]|nr:MBL fold metallo-hydrolase [Candidatus Portnoybacteria bacterium]
MTISWYGLSCFKITNQGGHLTIITDPFNKSFGLKPPRGSADIVTVSHEHDDHNNVKAISGSPFIINNPGEYEIKGIRIIGCSSFHDKKQGQERGLNTIYLIKIDKIRICHLGDLGQERLTDEQLETIGQVDILIIPIGGLYTIEASEAVKVAKQIEPSLIIPMHYKLPGLKLKFAGVGDFLKEMGLNKKPAVDKLTIKKKDLIGQDMEVVVFKP